MAGCRRLPDCGRSRRAAVRSSPPRGHVMTVDDPAARRRAAHFTAVPETATLAILDPEDDVAPVRRQDVEAGSSFTLSRVMSVRECARLVAYAEAAGFAPAGLAVGDDEYRVNEKARNNLRVIVEDRVLAGRLWR